MTQSATILAAFIIFAFNNKLFEIFVVVNKLSENKNTDVYTMNVNVSLKFYYSLRTSNNSVR